MGCAEGRSCRYAAACNATACQIQIEEGNEQSTPQFIAYQRRKRLPTVRQFRQKSGPRAGRGIRGWPSRPIRQRLGSESRNSLTVRETLPIRCGASRSDGSGEVPMATSAKTPELSEFLDDAWVVAVVEGGVNRLLNSLPYALVVTCQVQFRQRYQGFGHYECLLKSKSTENL
jgi:hypothetical protein